ncbi:hypothetical protein PMZ80_011000 [Knufia obscura]|uniref:Uncharacterized protein n=1 Tax=Knufia obscura TaxID=1635080 RepID=A0ABR0R7Y5_9EURO|nr:hypothetical protein PMZ80_011000 [Knufia obscura]
MRRRDAKYNSKAYKALFDAFVESTRSGDVQLSTAISLAMQAIDPTGQLATIGQSYAQAPTSDVCLPQSTKSAVEFVFKFGTPHVKGPHTITTSSERSADGDVLRSPSSTNCSPATAADSDLQVSPIRGAHDPGDHCRSRLINIGTHIDAPMSFIDITMLWASLAKAGLATRIDDDILPSFAYDICNIKTDDPLSNAITSFRDGARHMIRAGANPKNLIGDSTPCLDAFIGHNSNKDINAWSWACQIAKASSERSVTFQLALVYIAGIQMRVGFIRPEAAVTWLTASQFFIAPSAETYDDLPPMLRPLSKQYTVPHIAAIDICHLPVFKDFLLSGRDHYKNVLLSKQSCNWPYSDAACLVYEETERKSVKMSQAFIEHVRRLGNFSVDPDILKTAPQMACHVRHTFRHQTIGRGLHENPDTQTPRQTLHISISVRNNTALQLRAKPTIASNECRSTTGVIATTETAAAQC